MVSEQVHNAPRYQQDPIRFYSAPVIISDNPDRILVVEQQRNAEPTQPTSDEVSTQSTGLKLADPIEPLRLGRQVGQCDIWAAFPWSFSMSACGDCHVHRTHSFWRGKGRTISPHAQ